jgi:hypothetical protein
LLVHAAREEHLADGVVDLVRAGVKEVFAFQIDFCATTMLRQACGVRERRGPAYVVVQESLKF